MPSWLARSRGATLGLNGFSPNGYRRVSPVAVAGSDVFWSANGYRRYRRLALPGGHGAGAVCMSTVIQTACRVDFSSFGHEP